MDTVLTVIFYAIIMALVFGVLIFVHEFGHFITARRCGVTIKEFAVGMGPTLFSWKSKKYDTKYALRLLPIGGFVSMEGEDEESEDENAFCKKSVPKRMLVVVAGALMNFLLGFLLMLAVVLFQGPIYTTTVSGFGADAVSDVQLQVGDEILEVDGTSVHSYNEVVYEIANKGYQPIDILVERNGEEKILENVSFKTTESDGATFGVVDFRTFEESRSFGSVMKQTFFRSVSTVKMVYDSLIGLVTGRFGIEAVSGPVGVAQVVGDAAQTSYISLIYIISVLSINLGVVNLLPFPALDGGRFLFLGIEGVIKRPINRKVESFVNFIGIIILFGFMIFISFKDVFKLIL